MKPTQQFINMIGNLYQSRQKAVTNSDYNKHNNGSVSFYIISEMTVQDFKVVKQTEPFSDQKLIEIGKNVVDMVIGNDQSQTEYKRTDSMKFELHEGNGLLHWKVQNTRGEKFTVVKLLAPDGCVQLKLITADNKTQYVYNVCELPD